MLGAMVAGGFNYPLAWLARFGRCATMKSGRVVLGAKLGVDRCKPFTGCSRFRSGGAMFSRRCGRLSWLLLPDHGLAK